MKFCISLVYAARSGRVSGARHYFFGVDAEAVPSRVLLSCTSEALVCLREDGMLLGVEAPCDAEWTPKRCPPVLPLVLDLSEKY